ncbi:MAG: glycosyltransferase family 2 protein [Nitrospirota bacterium]
MKTRLLNPKTSIVLLSKNGGPLLRDVLEGAFAQPGNFEVIAVDSGSTDGTLEILKGYPVRMFQIPPDEFNHGLTRNFGASKVSPDSEYLVFLSQDAIPLPGWLNALIRPMEIDPAVAGVFSRQVPRKGGNPILRRYMTQEWEQCGGVVRIIKEITDRDDYERRKGWYTAFGNTSSAVRREVFGKFPFRAAEFAEDRLWAQDVLEAGYKIIYEPASTVVHSHDYSLAEQFRQNFDDAASEAAGASAGARRGNPFLRLPVKMAKDAAYIWNTAQPLPARMGWLLYIPLWHMAVLLGRLLGMIRGVLPGGVIRILSRQARIKHENSLHV